ncbi:MAG TPA: diacylglycerol kinase family protein [Candidatus Saccharimonadales bacterium]|nr:diacylglycerol kinase family protein [Candidatus Saccharimonadales bacterium]
MNTLNAELLINTGSRRGARALPLLLDACKQHNITVQKVHQLKRSTDLKTTLQRIKRRRPSLLIIGGGDGTISDAVDFLAGSKIEIGVMPLGTTNNFARSLNMPLDIDNAIRTIRTGRASGVDLGKVKNDYFVNVTGIGISAHIAKHVSDKQKKYFGRFAYTIVGAYQLIRHKPFFVTIQDKDGELQLNFETHQVIVANGRYHAGKEIAKEAKINNRELIIFALGGRSKLSFIYHTIDFYIGKRNTIKHASYLTGRNITLHTSTPQPVELDGEVKFSTPVSINVKPGAVNIRR